MSANLKGATKELGIFSLTILLVSAHYGLGFLLGTAEQAMHQGIEGSLYGLSIGWGFLALLWFTVLAASRKGQLDFTGLIVVKYSGAGLQPLGLTRMVNYRPLLSRIAEEPGRNSPQGRDGAFPGHYLVSNARHEVSAILSSS